MPLTPANASTSRRWPSPRLCDEELIEGTRCSTMKELAEQTINADKVLVF